MEIRVADEISALHHWPGAKHSRRYLANPHLHDFLITVFIEVEGDDREVELHDTRQRLHSILSEMGGLEYIVADPFFDFGSRSCEQIGKEVLLAMPDVLRCEVDEDKFGGAIVYHKDVYNNLEHNASTHDIPLSQDFMVVKTSMGDISVPLITEIVTLCGSMKSGMLYWEQAKKKIEAEGDVVLTLEFPNPGDPPLLSYEKEILDWVHKQKISRSDRIHVLNKDGYVGPSTQSEIDFARALGKKITFEEA
jgi:hypothetical protein